MEICVFGAGSLGTLVGGLLASEHRVTLVGREPHVGAIQADGLRMTGEVERTVRPAASTIPPERADLTVVTVKSFDTSGAVDALADCELGATLSLQNGIGNEELLAAHLDCPALAGTCTYGARLSSPGVVECTGIGEITLGPRGGGSSELADRVGRAFTESALDATVTEDMPRRLWEKLAVNAGINATTALARVQNGALVDGPGGDVATAAARETARVASTAGVELDQQAVAEQSRTVAETTAANTSSMLQDVRAGTRTEVDAINGAVVERADDPVPVNETLVGLLHAWEREQGLYTASDSE